MSSTADPTTSSIITKQKSSRELVQDALDANKRLQQILTLHAEQLEADLKEADNLLDAASADDAQDDPESEIVIPGAKKATGLFPLAEFLNPVSPFYEEAIKRSNYLTNINVHPMKEKDLEVLADAVRRENQRLQAYKSQDQGPHSLTDTTTDLDNNVEGLDWTKIAERVSDASSVKRTAIDCRVCWIGDRHPRINHGEWAAPEVTKLSELVSEVLEAKSTVDWVEVAKQLGTNRTPLDCLRHGLPRQRHSWTTDQDQKLTDYVKSCGLGNWQLVAMNVSPHATAAQCQNRWFKSLDPVLQRGSWTKEDDDRLRKAVAGYGSSWIQVALAIPGRTNDQCRERWHEQVNRSTKKLAWTQAEDKILLENVNLIGKRWKTISLKIGNNRTGPTCRLRYDKLMRLQNTRNSAAAPTTQDRSSSTTQTQSSSSSVEVPLPTIVVKPRPIGKGKAKQTIVELEQNIGPVPSLPHKAVEFITIGRAGTNGGSQTTSDGSTTMPAGMTALWPVLRPTPIARAKRKSAAVEEAPSSTTSVENAPESGVPSSENLQNAPRRGSKRDIVTQLDETPVLKKRKTQAKPALISMSDSANPAISSTSMSLPQSVGSASVVTGADEITQEHDPAPTLKRTLRKHSQVPVKKLRGQTRK